MTWWNWQYHLRYVLPEMVRIRVGGTRSDEAEKREKERVKRLEGKGD